MIEQGEKYIVNTMGRIPYKDGKAYEYVYGKCSIVQREGYNPLYKTDERDEWWLKISGEDSEILVPGFHITSLVKCSEPIIINEQSKNWLEDKYNAAKILIL